MIRYYDTGSGGPRVQLVTCPACGEPLDGDCKTSHHFLNDHLPEDFGLSPLGEHSPAIGSAAETELVADGGARHVE